MNAIEKVTRARDGYDADDAKVGGKGMTGKRQITGHSALQGAAAGVPAPVSETSEQCYVKKKKEKKKKKGKQHAHRHKHTDTYTQTQTDRPILEQLTVTCASG